MLLYLSSNFCVTMAEQLRSNPWRNNFVEGKIGTTPQKRPKNDLNCGVGSSYGTNKPPLRNRFPMKHLWLGDLSVVPKLFSFFSFLPSTKKPALPTLPISTLLFFLLTCQMFLLVPIEGGTSPRVQFLKSRGGDEEPSA